MPSNNKDLLSYLNPLHYEDSEVKKLYRHWYATSKIIQIRAITILTALLYIAYSQIDKSIVSSSILSTMTAIHLYALPLCLFFIAALTFNNKYKHLMIFLLTVAPVAAAIGSLYIISTIDGFNIYLPELYLIVIWVFTLSGLTFMNALVSASAVFIMAILAGFNLRFQHDLLLMHLLWLSSAFSFGLLTAFIMEKSHKLFFLNKRKLEYTAMTDGLTGLYNRSKVETNIAEEMQRAKRYNREFSIIVLDIDDFKKVNDNFGHHIGDIILKEISILIQENIRTTDTVGRWGGEEFLILLPETNLEKAQHIAEQLRLKVESYRFTVVKQKTCSFGVTEYLQGDSIQSAINRADKALYQSKDGGKNQVQTL